VAIGIQKDDERNALMYFVGLFQSIAVDGFGESIKSIK